MNGPRTNVERQVVRALGSIGAATLASRVLGFARDMAVALVFGAGTATDAFFVAFRIPNVLRRLLAEGALSTAAVPVFTDYLVHESREAFVRMVRAVTGAALLVLGLVAAAGILLAPWLVPLIAPGFSDKPAQLAVTVLLTRIMFPYLVLVGIAALGMGLLNAEGRFFAAAFGPAVLNVGMIAGVALGAWYVRPPILGIAIGVLLGGIGQVLVQCPDLRRLGLLVAPSADLGHPALGRIVRLVAPSVFGLAAVQIMVFVNTLLASLLPTGSISYLYYADRVMEFPLGIFGIALASASLPAMSRQATAGDLRAVAATLNFALRMSTFICVPATVGLVLFREPMTRVLFERGRFGPEETAATATALAYFGLGLVGFAGARIAAQVFYAIREPGIAVRMGLVAVGVNVLAALALVTPLAHGGLALASSIGAWVNLVALALAARRRFGPLGGRRLLGSAARTLVAAAALAAWCLAARYLWPAQAGGVREAAWLAGGIAGGTVVFLAAARLVRAEETHALLAILPGRRRD